MDPHTVWNRIMDSVKEEVDALEFNRWFASIKAIKLDENILTIEVPNQFVYERLENQYLHLLKKGVKNELGNKGKLEYQLLMPDFKNAGTKAKTKTNPVAVNTKDLSNYNPFVIPGIKTYHVDPNLNEQYQFDNFIEGDCNRVARQAGINISKNPGRLFNPLIIYGGVGLGKTHLAQAIGNGLKQNFPDQKLTYISTDKFTNQFIMAVKNNSANEFANFYNNLDTIILDDIQFLAGKAGTQEVFFHLFNHLQQGNKQIILTADRAPKDLVEIEDRLISRFKWGLTIELTQPDFETRLAILLSKLDKLKIELPMDVCEFIAMKLKDNIREMEGVLISLVAQSTINKKSITKELTDEVISEYSNKASKSLGMDDIIQIVCDQLKVDRELLLTKTRKSHIVQARQLATYFTRKFVKSLSLKNIGEYFGGKDHSTVLHSCKVVENMIQTDPSFKDTANLIEKKILKTIRVK